MDGAGVSGRHFTFSHSLVSARCTPTSRPGFSLQQPRRLGKPRSGDDDVGGGEDAALVGVDGGDVDAVRRGHVVAFDDQANFRGRGLQGETSEKRASAMARMRGIVALEDGRPPTAVRSPRSAGSRVRGFAVQWGTEFVRRWSRHAAAAHLVRRSDRLRSARGSCRRTAPRGARHKALVTGVACAPRGAAPSGATRRLRSGSVRWYRRSDAATPAYRPFLPHASDKRPEQIDQHRSPATPENEWRSGGTRS